ncbi:kinase [Thraustotheca clavata]|uniref:Kinase n=1 Tax=Thraustotheca clavata TaxID=74557 RepID=A0A1V9ZXZ8_9STRA|nr:kinase [Thraustotheca clavata]
MNTTIVCSVCSNPNEILLKKCTDCGEILPPDHEKLRILILRSKHLKPAASNGNSEYLQEIANLKEQIAENARQYDEIKHQYELSQQQLTQRQIHRQPTSELEDERAALATERTQLLEMRRLIGTLQTIPYIDPTQFQCDTVLSTAHKYELQLGSFNGRTVVMKRLLRSVMDEQDCDRFRQSIARLAKLNGGEGTILSLVGASNVGEKNPQAYLEYMEKGDLRHYLRTTARSQLSWKTRVNIALNIARALKYLHGLDLIHRDLSSHHVLLNASKDAKLTGLSNTRQIDFNGMTNGVGNFRWVSPESMVEGKMYSEKTDIYSLGLIMIELDTHEIPYSSCLHRGRVMGDFMLMEALMNATPGAEITKHKFKDSPHWYRDLALRCTNLDPEKRPSAVEIASILHNQLREMTDMSSIDVNKVFPALRLPPAIVDLNLTVIRAKNLLDTQVFGTQDPFCKLSLGGKIATTNYHDNGGVEPRWGRVFTFQNIHPLDNILEVNILNKNWVMDGQIGKSTIPLEMTVEKVDERLSLTSWFQVYSRGDQQGQILLKFEYKGDLARWLTEYQASLENFKATRGHVRTMQSDEIQMEKITQILIPRLQAVGFAAAGIAGRVAGLP